jgi:hypothetical protein
MGSLGAAMDGQAAPYPDNINGMFGLNYLARGNVNAFNDF